MGSEDISMKESILRTKSFNFAVDIVHLTSALQNERREYVISKQLLRSGTAIGALLAEVRFGQSKADYIHKFSISLKEANESRYWLRLLLATSLISENQYDDLDQRCNELVSMLVSSIKTLKN